MIFRRVQSRSGQVQTGNCEGHKGVGELCCAAGIGITTTVGRFSTELIRTCKGLPSGGQKILVILHSPKLIEVQLQLRLTLLNGVFFCDCEIDISNCCVQMMSSSSPHSKSPRINLSVANGRLKLSVLTFNETRGSVLEYRFNKRVMS